MHFSSGTLTYPIVATAPNLELSGEDLQGWLGKAKVAAAIKQEIQDVVAGKHLEVPPELFEQAITVRSKREVVAQIEKLHQRMPALAERMGEEPHGWPKISADLMGVL